jgi:hypothetical protein
MTDDIVTRLRLWASVTEGDHVIEELHRAADEIERLREQRDRYAERFLKLQGDYADLLKVANTYYMACLHPQDPCKVCQAFEEHVHD